MNNIRYPVISRTLLITMGYTLFYFLTYMFAAISYSAVVNVPADQSRSISWLYYGVLFTIIPYLGSLVIALADINHVRHNSKNHIILLHTFFVTQIVDKLGIAFLATLLAQDFPYGRAFPSSGYNMLCEELPFYCSSYIEPYLIINTFGGVIIFTAAYFFTKSSLKIK